MLVCALLLIYALIDFIDFHVQWPWQWFIPQRTRSDPTFKAWSTHSRVKAITHVYNAGLPYNLVRFLFVQILLIVCVRHYQAWTVFQLKQHVTIPSFKSQLLLWDRFNVRIVQNKHYPIESCILSSIVYHHLNFLSENTVLSSLQHT